MAKTGIIRNRRGSARTAKQKAWIQRVKREQPLRIQRLQEPTRSWWLEQDFYATAKAEADRIRRCGITYASREIE